METTNQDRTIKVVLINSASEKFFCAGADIKVFGTNTIEQRNGRGGPQSLSFN
ncbi:enoyl-CoA hydratase/isomerase family protein [Flavobacterium ovatum]|uniref:enoyl-CoA hydratase/isomerase family protein n=1 Tax=Flavobacterium ovatum TaxID=1928857 RepID=UPI00344D039F